MCVPFLCSDMQPSCSLLALLFGIAVDCSNLHLFQPLLPLPTPRFGLCPHPKSCLFVVLVFRPRWPFFYGLFAWDVHRWWPKKGAEWCTNGKEKRCGNIVLKIVVKHPSIPSKCSTLLLESKFSSAVVLVTSGMLSVAHSTTQPQLHVFKNQRRKLTILPTLYRTILVSWTRLQAFLLARQTLYLG